MASTDAPRDERSVNTPQALADLLIRWADGAPPAAENAIYLPAVRR
jgi:hypothetical protein